MVLRKLYVREIPHVQNGAQKEKTMRINKSYQSMFANNCPVIEVTGDGVECGTCTYYLRDGVCPRHGDVKAASFINGMYYTPEHIADPSAGSGAFLKEAADQVRKDGTQNPPYGKQGSG